VRRLSLRSRLLAGVGLVAVVLTLVAIVITASTRARLIDQVDDRLVAGASDGRPGSFDDGDGRDGDRDGRGTDPDGSPERRSDFYEGVLAADGTLTTIFVPNIGGDDFGPPDLDPDAFDLESRSGTIVTAPAVSGDVEYRVLVTTDGRGETAFVTALPLDAVESTITRLVTMVVIAVAIVLAVLAVVTWWMLHLGIRPIKQMTTTASTIAGGDLSARADESSTAAESYELAIALNTMMETIETALDERAASEERLRRFVSDASHELRTPVTTIRGYAELYRLGGLAEPGRLDDAMRRTEAESARMARLVDDMLTLAKLDEQRPLAHERVDMARLAGDAAADARAASPGRVIEVDAPDPAVVLGDDDRLRQVVANLVTNAVTHTEADVPVTVRARVVDDRVVVEVIDRGAGMSPDVVDRVTERFFRADPSRTRQRGGSGLGLSIVDSTVGAHGGTVNVDSAPGRGTRVTVELPAAPADLA
jgi:two-component system OmpR family sensor kinase